MDMNKIMEIAEKARQERIKRAFIDIKTCSDFREVADEIVDCCSYDTLVNLWEVYIAENEIYNSPLAKALREEE
jgi:hypothetical protein